VDRGHASASGAVVIDLEQAYDQLRDEDRVIVVPILLFAAALLVFHILFFGGPS
jgi:hypothetical protein